YSSGVDAIRNIEQAFYVGAIGVGTKRFAKTLAADPTTGRIFLPVVELGCNSGNCSPLTELRGTSAVLVVAVSK
ncbi:MAG: hypothetical protein ACREAC_19420, partial [Blastocatellia bacterium]